MANQKKLSNAELATFFGQLAMLLDGGIYYREGIDKGEMACPVNLGRMYCLGLGVEPEHVRVVVPLPKNMPEITRVIKEEIEYKGVSVIIPRRECIQTFARHARAKKQ